MRSILATILLIGCAAEPKHIETPLDELTCEMAEALSPPIAFQLLEQMDNSAERYHARTAELEQSNATSSRLTVDQAWANLGTTLGQKRVLCACHEQLRLMPSCVEHEQIMKSLFD